PIKSRLIVSIECAGGFTRLRARGIPPAPFGPLASDFGTIASQSVHAESIRQAKPGRAQSADGVLSPLPVGPYGSALQRLPRFIRPENRTIEPRAYTPTATLCETISASRRSECWEARQRSKSGVRSFPAGRFRPPG